MACRNPAERTISSLQLTLKYLKSCGKFYQGEKMAVANVNDGQVVKIYDVAQKDVKLQPQLGPQTDACLRLLKIWESTQFQHPVVVQWKPTFPQTLYLSELPASSVTDCIWKGSE